MELYGLLLWKGMCVHQCGVYIVYRRLSDWTHLQTAVGIAQLADALGESILCCEGCWCGCSQMTLGGGMLITSVGLQQMHMKMLFLAQIYMYKTLVYKIILL